MKNEWFMFNSSWLTRTQSSTHFHCGQHRNQFVQIIVLCQYSYYLNVADVLIKLKRSMLHYIVINVLEDNAMGERKGWVETVGKMDSKWKSFSQQPLVTLPYRRPPLIFCWCCQIYTTYCNSLSKTCSNVHQAITTSSLLYFLSCIAEVSDVSLLWFIIWQS